MLTAFAPVPRLGWIVFVELPLREALAPVYASLWRTAGLLVLGLLLAAVAGTWLARRMVVPIRDLQTGAERLGSGERSQPIEIHTGDEIETLADRFNQMAAKVQELHDTLEAKVDARTEELRVREREARDARLAAEQALADLHQAQDRLVETQKLASLGQLTAGIAHEIKNPLNFVNNFAELSAELSDELSQLLAAREAALPEAARAEIDGLIRMLNGNLAKIVEHGKRADSIVKNMLLHSRTGTGEHRPSNLNALIVESSEPRLSWRARRKAGFQCDFAAGSRSRHRRDRPLPARIHARPAEPVRQWLLCGTRAAANGAREAGLEPALAVDDPDTGRPGRNPRARQRHRHSRVGRERKFSIRSSPPNRRARVPGSACP